MSNVLHVITAPSYVEESLCSWEMHIEVFSVEPCGSMTQMEKYAPLCEVAILSVAMYSS